MQEVFSLKHTFLFLTVIFLSWQSFSQQIEQQDSLSQEIDNEFLKLKHNLEDALKQENNDIIALHYTVFADFYKKNGAVNEALANYRKAIELLPDSKDTTVVYIQMRMGEIHFSLKHMETAKEYFYKALGVSKEIGFTKGEAMANSNIGSCFEKTFDYKNALRHQKAGLQLFQKINDSLGLALANENIGSVYEDQMQFDLAYQYFEKAFLYEKTQLHSDRKINILNNLGDANRKSGNYEKAFFYTEEAKRLAEESNNKHQLESAYKDLSRTFNLMGDYEKAYLNLLASDTINEEMLLLENMRQVNSLQALYEAKDKEAKIDLLTKENEINKAEERLMIIIIVMLLLLGIIGWIYFKKRKAHEIKLQQYKQQILQTDLEKKTLKEENMKREIQLKTSSLSKYSLHLAHKNKILSNVAHVLTNLKDRNLMDMKSKLNEVVGEINQNLSEKQEWEQFMNYFEQIHPSFFKNLGKATHDELSASELRLCMLLKINLSSKEIASILHITPDSIRIARYRLRKKLSIERGEKLTRFLQKL
ncbi:tetratricopeptide repeat protein [Galbibacter sp. EGI 63066]|uniref:tetratricopeptide repeat protein n=1 Tax=Galbibacter sp. EGI 63066 TaxID=2993559 RepID=UPI002248FF18|nr:tetratricopeptide repeat protein [Galbibacter sp. EGI 63066]MCX2681811.1 tetratricopeptide repeat protein [Galbibacter sp. EGI 63066]